MISIIDSFTDMGPQAADLAACGVRWVVRHYGAAGADHGAAALDAEESRRLAAAGLSIIALFRPDPGTSNDARYYSAQSGQRDAAAALDAARRIGQPAHSAIYFDIAGTFTGQNELAAVSTYMSAVRNTLDDAYRIGICGSGPVCGHVMERGLATLAYLASAPDTPGHIDFLRRRRWALWRGPVAVRPVAGVTVAAAFAHPAQADVGQFRPDETVAPAQTSARAPLTPRAVFRVRARDGQVLRQGPGTEFAAARLLPADTLVFGLPSGDRWLQADLCGDGLIDGYLLSGLLEPVLGGFELTTGAGMTPYDVARAELAADAALAPDLPVNPRVYLYQSTTRHGEAENWSWCSSFVNYCVQAAGLCGTGSRAPRSWLDQSWGRDVTEAPAEGDIAVFERRWTSPRGGRNVVTYVGFVATASDDHIFTLGGNGHDRLSIRPLPRNGYASGDQYTLRSVRRAAA